MAKAKACQKCHRIVEGNICPTCKDSDLTKSWKGYSIILNPDESALAEELGAETPGKYALRIKK